MIRFPLNIDETRQHRACEPGFSRRRRAYWNSKPARRRQQNRVREYDRPQAEKRYAASLVPFTERVSLATTERPIRPPGPSFLRCYTSNVICATKWKSSSDTGDRIGASLVFLADDLAALLYGLCFTRATRGSRCHLASPC